MKISIITIVKNCETLIEQTIKSVVNQTFTDFEYIVIDGGSTDNTLSVIESYKKKITKVVSEPDNGISDAFNKGILLAKGDWLLFLNAGDCFPKETILTDVAPNLPVDKKISLVYGKIANVNFSGKILKVSGDCNYRKKVRWHMPFPHQATFHRKTLFEKYGLYDLSFKRAMDYEFILRIKHLKAVFIPVIVSNMLLGGISQSNYYALFKECKKAHELHFNTNVQVVWMHYFYMLWRVRLILIVRKVIGKSLK